MVIYSVLNMVNLLIHYFLVRRKKLSFGYLFWHEPDIDQYWDKMMKELGGIVAKIARIEIENVEITKESMLS